MSDRAALLERFRRTRAGSVALAAPLSDADASAQSMPDASPAKWHLAHSSWFFETFVLRDHVPGYRAYDPRFAPLFNSYYEAEGPRQPRSARGLLTRPSLEEVRDWRAAVDAALCAALPDLGEEGVALVALGLAHEEQHQELLLTDLLHLFAQNPLGPAAYPRSARPRPEAGEGGAEPLRWIGGREGVVEIGHTGGGFAFDCEGPRHAVVLAPHALAHRPVSNGEWAAFIADGGYREPRHWLSDGWAWVQATGVTAPLYWREGSGGWEGFTLHGWRALDPAASICHISLYEADAYASWAGARLPTEAEWEDAAAGLDPSTGQLFDDVGDLVPGRVRGEALAGMFGGVWEWTASAYRPYPGFRAAAGAVGEYNGKFMNGQYVLRGGSVATPRGHVRAAYRNFFMPHQRWQFAGVRLARDV